MRRCWCKGGRRIFFDGILPASFVARLQHCASRALSVETMKTTTGPDCFSSCQRVRLALGLFLCAASIAHAATYYVSNSGSNGADGLTPATAFATLQYCANRAQPGDTFLVADGNYAGFNITRSGAAGQPVTFKALGNAARITSPNAFTNRDGINVEGGSWITIDGFVCSNHTRAGIRLVTNSHCVVRNCDCETNGTWGIFTGFTDDLTLELGSGLVEEGTWGKERVQLRDVAAVRHTEKTLKLKKGILAGERHAGGVRFDVLPEEP